MAFWVGLALIGGGLIFFHEWRNQRKKSLTQKEESSKEAEMVFIPESTESENRNRELEIVKNEYFSKKEKIKRLHDILINSIKENPELIYFIPPDTFIYKGYFRERVKRFQARQMEKTAEAIIPKIEKTKKLCQELTALYKEIANLERAYGELGMVEIELEIKERELIADLKKRELKEQVELLELEKKKAQLEKEIEEIRSGKIDYSLEERILQNTENLIRELVAKNAGIVMFLEAKEKILSYLEFLKDSPFYQRIENMWDHIIFQLFEKKK